jgi:hypothetical protein
MTLLLRKVGKEIGLRAIQASEDFVQALILLLVLARFGLVWFLWRRGTLHEKHVASRWLFLTTGVI